MSKFSIAAEDPAVLRQHLRAATRECSERGLIVASKWAAELLNSLPPVASTSQLPPLSTAPRSATGDRFRTSTPARNGASNNIDLDASCRGSFPNVAAISQRYGGRDSLGSVSEMMSGFSPVHALPPTHEGMLEDDGQQERYLRQDELEEDQYLLALSYLRVHEHLRAAFVLKDCVGPRARWLRTYTKFLAGEKRVQEEAGALLGVADKGALNPYASELLADMDSWEEGFTERDGWLLYIKSLLLLCLPPISPSPFPTRDAATTGGILDLRLAAMDALVASVKLVPYNWSAWLKLAACLDGAEELEATMQFIPPVFPSLFFYVHATLEIHAAGESLHETLDELGEMFPRSSTVTGLRALVHYHVREFEEATRYFLALQKSDPYRVEDIDIFSNILYVTESRAELAALAQEYTKTDRARPEVCCLVGNYYSLRREHEKAILYFRRALKLDKAYLSAWTLMGHEYVEIKNTNAAIASYRRAVDVNRKDYRAWYGLGQTYELLGEPFYALSYYQKATALRPYDTRMWSALATCYEKLKRIPDAIKSYQRALVSSEAGDNDIALRIGRLYASIGQSLPAGQYHRRALAEGIKANAPRTELSKIWLWLARFEMGKGEEGDLATAQEYLREVVTVQEDKEEAKALLLTLETMMKE